jgi:chromosomal replication initiator protein
MDLATARTAVAQLMPSARRRITVEQIEEAVSRHYRVRVADMHSTRRSRSITRPRHVAMYLARELTTLSWKEIGVHFGRSNHTGALYAHDKITAEMATDAVLADVVRRLRAELEA